MSTLLTTQQVAERFGVEQWQVRRLFEDKMLPEPDKFAGKRMIVPKLLPKIEKCLIKRGWIEAAPTAAVTA